jgi:dihydroflavonol-4-reductase
MTLGGILKELAAITGRKAPTLKLPYFVAWTAGAITTGLAYLTGIPPRAPLDAVRMAKKKMWVTHAKASRELGFAPAPARSALEDAVRWFSRLPGKTA